ncbi:MAG: hypothetical protein CMI66_05690 [Pedosphaera sp.]|nr:hypothetical protein [Pedosphaera sp.]
MIPPSFDPDTRVCWSFVAFPKPGSSEVYFRVKKVMKVDLNVRQLNQIAGKSAPFRHRCLLSNVISSLS